MISIFNHIYDPTPIATGGIETDLEPGGAPCRFAVQVLDCINSYVLAGEGGEPLRAELVRLQQSIRPEWSPAEAQAAHGIVARMLASHRESVQQAALAQAIEVQNIFAMLNHALIVLAEGRDLSVSRLNRIQDTLQRNLMLQDIVALKSAVTDTIRFVQQESVHARENAAEELNKIEEELGQARESLGNTRVLLAGRPEGVKRIAEWSSDPVPGQGLYAVAYLLDRMQTISQRYGSPVAEELVFRVIKERVQPLVPASATYRWTPTSLVAVFRRPGDVASLRSEVANLNRTPVVHRIALGNRTAVLTVSPSHLEAEGSQGSAADLIAQLDEFTRIAP
jgi:hypothetical protein